MKSNYSNISRGGVGYAVLGISNDFRYCKHSAMACRNRRAARFPALSWGRGRSWRSWWVWRGYRAIGGVQGVFVHVGNLARACYDSYLEGARFGSALLPWSGKSMMRTNAGPFHSLAGKGLQARAALYTVVPFLVILTTIRS